MFVLVCLCMCWCVLVGWSVRVWACAWEIVLVTVCSYSGKCALPCANRASALRCVFVCMRFLMCVCLTLIMCW